MVTTIKVTIKVTIEVIIKPPVHHRLKTNWPSTIDGNQHELLGEPLGNAIRQSFRAWLRDVKDGKRVEQRNFCAETYILRCCVGHGLKLSCRSICTKEVKLNFPIVQGSLTLPDDLETEESSVMRAMSSWAYLSTLQNPWVGWIHMGSSGWFQWSIRVTARSSRSYLEWSTFTV